MTNLNSFIETEASTSTFPAAVTFCERLQSRFGPATAAVVFYGSCLREKTDVGLLLDFYVLVDRYTPASKNWLSAAFARLLPPNVYYIEEPYEDRVVRAKVAVISVDQFLRGTGPDTFSSSLWARFAQPSVILFARNDEVRRRVAGGLANAVSTMIKRALPLVGATFTARELWTEGFLKTYGAELRPEKESKAGELVDADLARYAAVTTLALGPPDDDGVYQNPLTPEECIRGRHAWAVRRVQGKTLNALRLVKAAFTFSGGLDYAVWKIERHSGVKVELSDAERKRPLLTGLKLFLKTRREGGVR